MTKEVEHLELLVNIINIIVCHYEIPRFKYEKMNNYFSCLKQAAKAEFENHEFVIFLHNFFLNYFVIAS